ncbi:Glycosyltransferase sugar-binding region containing DXD motif-containing protein [Lactobacillus bombicola]|uniref:Glycosyltransferase sugar-binding region containing DXD motif-containing protein n=1 Tax=Lactobacillus bombicola TaxID=1505723 RepID=A0A1I1T315_9LACO|nr:MULTISPECIES: glycosyltransferase [Lactobacillus]MCO6527841.1 glycosyl transferase [Lactobacillus sp.]RMC42096.1 glycosyl transferase [Lactobacillus sp. ESL0233]SFD51428.1 Glycosyltransferase sugar-binding region containing DXD motif-containing protein [Lactobacillus bombicola]
MIPKIIHYVWVGGKPKPKNIQRCMKTWRKHLGDYQIIEWNEQNFNVHENEYVAQAYKAQKWAFVSDYIRAKAIYEQGGIYLDTDVLVLDDLAALLNNRAFVGFENKDNPFTAVFGAEPHHPLLKDMLAYYDGRDFTFDAKDQLAGVNTLSVSNILKQKYGAKANNQEQVLKEKIHVYPDGILCNPSAKSKTIHVFTGTWMEGEKPLKRKLVTALKVRIKTKKEAALYAKILK